MGNISKIKGSSNICSYTSRKSFIFYNRFKSRNLTLPDTFEASIGWFAKWQQRTGFYVKTENGESESESVDKNLVEEGRRELKDLLQDYDIEEIYNADELA